MCYRLCLLAAGLLATPGLVQANAFDHCTNPVLAKLITTDQAKEIKLLTPDLITDNDRVLPGVPAAFLIVQTGEGSMSKLLVQSARQKLAEEGAYLPTLRVERYVTYRPGEERAIMASGQGLTLFPGYRLSLEMGQVVPEDVGGDVRYVVTGNRVGLVPLGKTRMFLVVKPLPDMAPKKGPKLVVGEKFDPSYFNGTYKLYDDGRRSGKLTLHVEEDGMVRGHYYSDKDGSKYDVRGRVLTPKHSVQFTIQLPRSEQTFTGWLFTGDGQVMTGSSRLQEREAGFYAVRTEE